MKINKELIERLGGLAHIKFSKKEMDDMVKDLTKILHFINKLDEVKTDHVSALTHIHNTTNVYREDVPVDLGVKKSIIKNSPNHNSDYIKAPKVLKKD